LAVMWDMWLNKSAVWPVGHNPEWDEWEKLKSIPAKSEQITALTQRRMETSHLHISAEL